MDNIVERHYRKGQGLMFEPGTYRGKLKGGVVTEAKTGNLQMVVTFDVIEHWNGTAWESISTAERRVYISLTDDAMPWAIAKLESLGFQRPTGTFEDFANPQFQTDSAGVELTCKENLHKGKTSEKWELASWGGELEQAATSKLKQLNARMRAAGGTTRAASAAPTAPAAPAAPAAPPSEPPRTSTRAAAWEKLCSTWPDKQEGDLQKIWFEAIAALKKDEATFTPEDWGRVMETCGIPF